MAKDARARMAAVLAAAMMAVSLAACGDDDETAAPTTTTATEEPAGSPTVQIEYVDYAYRVSGPLVAGGTMQLRNSGKEFHMMGVGRLKPGKTLEDLKKLVSQGPPGGGEGEAGGEGGAGGAGGEGGEGGEEQDPLADVVEEVGLPGNIMGPGGAAELTVPAFGPGNYALICFLPTEGEGTPHFAKGMIAELKVVEGEAPEPSADATYRLATGRAPEGPTTLTAGRHTLKFEAAPGSEQLEPALAKPEAGKTYADLDEAISKLFEGEGPPPKNAAAQIPGELTFNGFDLREITEFYLALDFTPGTYLLAANDTDEEEEAPGPPEELTTIMVS